MYRVYYYIRYHCPIETREYCEQFETLEMCEYFINMLRECQKSNFTGYKIYKVNELIRTGK